ncbi:MAG: hypothetical protein LBP39_00640, partial [Rickettsiales bacterium]|nr:hypothetical protein [Rickettsiales bacterium]
MNKKGAIRQRYAEYKKTEKTYKEGSVRNTGAITVPDLKRQIASKEAAKKAAAEAAKKAASRQDNTRIIT